MVFSVDSAGASAFDIGFGEEAEGGLAVLLFEAILKGSNAECPSRGRTCTIKHRLLP